MNRLLLSSSFFKPMARFLTILTIGFLLLSHHCDCEEDSGIPVADEASCSPADKALPTPANWAKFQEQGVLVLPGLVPPESIRRARRHLLSQMRIGKKKKKDKHTHWNDLKVAQNDQILYYQYGYKFPHPYTPEEWKDDPGLVNPQTELLYLSPDLLSLLQSWLGTSFINSQYSDVVGVLPEHLPKEALHPEDATNCTAADKADRKIHVDHLHHSFKKIPDGGMDPFSLLVGIALSDQNEPCGGNTMVYPGSHLRLWKYFTDQYTDWHRANSTGLLSLMPPDAIDKEYWKACVEEIDPLPILLRPGDVFIAHWMLLHSGSKNYQDSIKHTAFFRLTSAQHQMPESLLDLWHDFQKKD